MQQCMAIKLDGHQCTRRAGHVREPGAPHLHFCATHWRTYDQRIETRRARHPGLDPHHVDGTCLRFAGRRWCGNPIVPGTNQCQYHIELNQELEQRRQLQQTRQARITELVEQYRQRDPPLTWRQVIDDIAGQADVPREDRFTIARRYFFHAAANDPEFREVRQFLAYWRWRMDEGGIGDPPNLRAIAQPRTDLAAIAQDRQNVHTQAVSQQTNQGLERLLGLRRQHGGTMRSPDWFASKWLVRSYGSWSMVSRVVNDIYTWYNQPSCRMPNDHLYRNTLDGLYLAIRNVPSDETKIELFKRTFEECFESVGMCCDGHISRLCNVMVGFDDAFRPPVPIGELIQSKMAAIAASEATTEEKIQQAIAFFNDMRVPEADRTAWLEAF